MGRAVVEALRELEADGSWISSGMLSTVVLPNPAVFLAGSPPLGNATGQTVSRVLQGVNIWSFWTQSPHQTFARVEGGNLGAPNYFQRTIVNQLNAPPPGGNPLPGIQIDLFGGSWATPTDWHAYEPKSTTHSYYFGGQYHEDDAWHWDAGVLEEKTPHQNGVLWRLSYEDGHDARYNDHILQVAVVWVQRYANALSVQGTPRQSAIEQSPAK